MKLPGKTVYSGRRRTTRQKSGFKSHPDSTGGEYKQDEAQVFALQAGVPAIIEFTFPKPTSRQFLGFGLYFCCDENVQVSIQNPNSKNNCLAQYSPPSFSKAGSMWWSDQGNDNVTLTLLAEEETEIALFNVECGQIWHEAFDQAIDNEQKSYLKSMHTIMPEAGFYVAEGTCNIRDLTEQEETMPVHLKSCNRCARFLPINLDNDREQLSFSNHCVARAPCTHGGFGILKNVESGETINLHYGYQLECRFCKKYFVNMPLNKNRTAAQMKEDGQRRRNFELLITELYQSSPQLSYRHKTGRELTDDIWNKFDRKCFNCHKELPSTGKMHLDHTRPLALLWPLDETATALCATCNTSKRDKPPSEFYDEAKIAELSELTGLTIEELMKPEPNHAVISELISRQDWFFEEFLTKPELLKEREGKITAELVVKALDKVLYRSGEVEYKYSFVDEYNNRRDAHVSYDDNEDLSSII